MNLAALADQRAPIVAVCRMIGMQVPDVTEGSVKVHCPFGEVYHADGGRDPAFRIYPATNSTWCFAGCGYFGPVGLYAQAKGMPREEAAAALCGHFHLSVTSTWEALLKPVEPVVDRAELAEALKTWAVREVPGFERRQFDDLGEVLEQCLGLLSLVNSARSAYTWLESSKAVLRRKG